MEFVYKAEIISTLKNLCDQSPVASYRSIGQTVLGADIWLFSIGDNTQAKFMVDGGLHGHEYQGSYCSYNFALWLLGNDPAAVDLLSKMQFLVVPCVNYDSLPVSSHGGTRTNSSGVDLNRNFTRGWYLHDEGTDKYSGPYAASEPETQALKSLFDNEENLKVYINIHDYGGDPATNGDFRPPYYMGSSYQTLSAELFNQYSQVIQSLGHAPHTLKPSYGAGGFARDDGCGSGEILSYLWEETQTYTINPETITADLIYYQKVPHLKAFAMATAELYGVASGRRYRFSQWNDGDTSLIKTVNV